MNYFFNFLIVFDFLINNLKFPVMSPGLKIDGLNLSERAQSYFTLSDHSSFVIDSSSF